MPNTSKKYVKVSWNATTTLPTTWPGWYEEPLDSLPPWPQAVVSRMEGLLDLMGKPRMWVKAPEPEFNEDGEICP